MTGFNRLIWPPMKPNNKAVTKPQLPPRMKARLITGLMLVVAVIHLMPLSGVLGTEQLLRLYGVAIAGPDLEILLRHRAVMFGILGMVFALAAFVPKYQPLAFLMAFVSIFSFLTLAWLVGDYQAAIDQVVLADSIAGACLLLALMLYYSGLKATNKKP